MNPPPVAVQSPSLHGSHATLNIVGNFERTGHGCIRLVWYRSRPPSEAASRLCHCLRLCLVALTVEIPGVIVEATSAKNKLV